MVQELLLQILRECLGSRKESEERLYTYNESLLELAYQHDIGLLIGDRIQLDRKQRLANRLAKQKNLERYYENFIHFQSVVEEFEKHNIRYNTTKGLVVAKTAYRNEEYRYSEDLDVVILKEDYLRVKEILNALGYVQGVYNSDTKSIIKYSRQQELFFLIYTNQSAPFLKKTGNAFSPVVNLDLNFHIFWNDNALWDMSELLTKSQEFSYKEFRIKTFQNEYLLLHLCLHAYFDLNSVHVLYRSYSYKLKYFADIYGFIKNSNLSWEKFRKICVKYKVEKYVMYVIYHTCIVFDDYTLLTLVGLRVPEESFLNRFGINNEGSFFWKDTFMDRLFCRDKSKLLDKYFDDDIKLKIKQGRILEGF